MEREPLTWSDFKMMSTWLAEEIAGNYIMDKKSYKRQPPDAPYIFQYRRPITLFREEKTIFAIFIRTLFFNFLKKGKTTGFDSKMLLRRIVHSTGLTGRYEDGEQLNALCSAFADEFPSFIRSLKDEGVTFDVAF